MKKNLSLGITLLLILTCSLPVFAAEESVPFVGGAYISDREDTPLTNEEQQLRLDAYNQILVLSETDDNIIEVRLSKDSRWVFLALAGDPVTEEHMALHKEYSRKFEQYTAFIVLTDADDIDRIEEQFAANVNPVEGGTGGINEGSNPYNTLWLLPVFGVLLLVAAFMLMQRKGFIPALQTTTGNVVTQNTAISKREAVLSVKQSEMAPDKKVFNSILREIDKSDM
ncbi:MAG: hypothetical protein FWH14_07490 [Oscillospiraceae bacterium]|nr:hypothetical protein [Oscillospiraceae bacterium]